MPMNVIDEGSADLPEIIPVFPLAGALLLPRGQMPLNIFEPRYLAMIDDSLRDGHRLIGMIQPDPSHPPRSEDKPTLFKVGCVGRITQLAESGDGRYLLQLTGIARFKRRGRAQGRDRLSPMPRHLSAVRRRFRRAQGRGRGRPRDAARSADRVPQGQQSQDRLGGCRECAERGAGQRARDDVALWRGRKAGAA